jgi:hypothetical protein
LTTPALLERPVYDSDALISTIPLYDDTPAGVVQGGPISID